MDYIEAVSCVLSLFLSFLYGIDAKQEIDMNNVERARVNIALCIAWLCSFLVSLFLCCGLVE